MSYPPSACLRVQSLLGLTHTSFNLLDIFVPMEVCESDNGNGCSHHFPKKLSPGLCDKCNKLTSLSEGSVDYELWKVCHWILFEFSSLFSDAFWTAIIRPIGNASLVALPGRTWLLPNADIVLLQTFLSPTVVSQWVLKWVSWFGFYLGAVWHWPLIPDAQNLARIALETSCTAHAYKVWSLILLRTMKEAFLKQVEMRKIKWMFFHLCLYKLDVLHIMWCYIYCSSWTISHFISQPQLTLQAVLEILNWKCLGINWSELAL